VEGVTFVDDLQDAVAAAKAAAGDKYVNVLSASTAKQCLDAGALDEILVLIAPVLLGDGVRLFEHYAVLADLQPREVPMPDTSAEPAPGAPAGRP
jgi:dihydrofolate reductase